MKNYTSPTITSFVRGSFEVIGKSGWYLDLKIC